MAHIVYFHRNRKAGYSINKVTQTIIGPIADKEEFYVPYLGGSPITVIKNIIFVWRHRSRYGINHITGDILYCMMALVGCRSVLTIHDVFGPDYQKSSFFRRQYRLLLWIKIPLRIATKVVCISEDTRDKLYAVTKRRDIMVIHNAVDPIFFASPKYALSHKPEILLIGTAYNKNIMRTFEALVGLNCHLTIIGALRTEQIQFLENNKIEYVNKVGLNDAQIVEEYVNCDIVSFISLFEGFGMIVIEANQVGRPVICSDIKVLHEVGGDAVLYVDPLNIESMRGGFLRLFKEDALRKTLVNKGFENVKRFNVDNIRKQWLQLYSEIY